MHYKNNFKFNLAILLMFTIFFSILPVGALASGADAIEKNTQAVTVAKEAAHGVVGFYSVKNEISDWEELGGIKGVGESLQNDKWKNKLASWENKNLKETEYASHILGMLAQGEDPRTIWPDKDIVAELEKKQGLNGSFGNLNSHIWAIVALDAAGGSYNVDKALDYLMSRQKADGGFDFWGPEDGKIGAPDDTGMALIALSNHNEKDNVQAAISKSISFLKDIQLSSGGFSSWGTENPNSIATIISGLIAVKEDIFEGDWVKGDKTMLDALLTFQLDDKSFFFPSDGEAESNSFATKQALVALGDIISGDSVWKRLDVGSVHLRIEGSSNNILDKNITVLANEKDFTIQEIIKKALEKDKISYLITESDLGREIFSIQSEAEGQFGRDDRWFYLVNGKALNTGIEGQKIKDGDEILIYYGMLSPDTIMPSIETSPSKPKVGEDFKITVRSQKESTVIDGATVIFNNGEYTTDDNGTVIIKSDLIDKAGIYYFKINKDVENSYPRIVRTGNIPVEYVKKDSSGPNIKPMSKKATLYVKADKKIILSSTEVDLQKADTPLSILKRELPGQVEYSGSGSNAYVTSIGGLAEFDKGPESGWMFVINGKFVQTSASNYKLEDGDRVEWLYTLDGGKDIGDVKTNGSSGAKAGNGSIPDISKEEVIEAAPEMKKILAEKVKQTSAKILAQDNISDWSLFTLVLNNNEIPEKYIKSLKNTIKENKGEFRKTTDLERIVLISRSLGLNPLNIEGVNLIEKIYNHTNPEKQGVNGVAFALIALDSDNYEIPEGARWTRDILIKTLLNYQHPDGSFSLAKNGESDIDITAMAVQSLSNYKDQDNAKKAIEKALNYLASNSKSENCESVAQTIIAITSLGMNPEDSSFNRENESLISRLLSYFKEDGSFSHFKDGPNDEIATEQALTALIAYDRYLNGQDKIYILTDKKTKADSEEKLDSTKSYSDINEVSDWALRSVLKAKEYKLMQGTDLVKNTFEGKRSITRAEFVSLLVKLLEKKSDKLSDNTITSNSKQVYEDVNPGDWHFRVIMKAREEGLIVGVTPDTFAPQKEITREEIAAILVRALKFDTSLGVSDAAIIKDANDVSKWAKKAVYTAYKEKILVGDNGYFSPKNPVTREMAAAISVRLYEMD